MSLFPERRPLAAVAFLARYPTRVLTLFLILAAVLVVATSAAAESIPVTFPAKAQQGSMVIGRVPPGSRVTVAGRELRVTDYGTVVFGVGRDASGAQRVDVITPAGEKLRVSVTITPREWPIERIDGVPPKTVSPPAEIAARIAREQAAVSAERTRNDDRIGFTQAFIWPVEGRISGRFGNQRIYNGTPGSAHSGMDIAAAEGTPVKAPASGVITFADDLYLTGGTVLLDHGYGISSNFLHLSHIDVAVGDSVEQGQTIGTVGSTGRATGPHLHWGMNWFDTRIDPLLVLERTR
ncbi:M23 family metallopeptidase [Salinicola rhizosphaerae]|uniref:Peptidase n=1 Tax=Salinicola rhizosphaerae TaxID=1443141 RepID=A0ABQ3DUS4_9GAMM|nr:M23 family metallopeptidase [Salinicola rhizosphaerae]GHB13722.1 peptidase [Salinicola rhizosphaerae]